MSEKAGCLNLFCCRKRSINLSRSHACNILIFKETRIVCRKRSSLATSRRFQTLLVQPCTNSRGLLTHSLVIFVCHPSVGIVLEIPSHRVLTTTKWNFVVAKMTLRLCAFWKDCWVFVVLCCVAFRLLFDCLQYLINIRLVLLLSSLF